MNQQMDPVEFAERMDHAFGHEPAVSGVEADLLRGRSRLRRRRVGAVAVAAAVAVGVAGVGVALPGLASPEVASAPAWATGGATASKAEVRRTCLRAVDVTARDAGRDPGRRAALATLGQARVLTLASSSGVTVATMLAEDRTRWGECTMRLRPDGSLRTSLDIYPTDVTFPSRTVDGVRVYDEVAENDPHIEGSATAPVPQLRVPCRIAEPEDTTAYDRAMAACDRFSVVWNDRRVPEVARVRVETPDGGVHWADVRRGYLSLAVTGEMTPQLSRAIARGEAVAADRVVFYDAHGRVLVDAAPFARRRGTGRTLGNFPSLAYFLKE